MDKREQVLKPLIIRDLVTGALMYVKFDGYYKYDTYHAPTDCTKDTLISNTISNFGNNIELVEIEESELINLILEKKKSSNKKNRVTLNDLADKILLVEGDVGNKTYWLSKIFATVKIKDADEVVLGNHNMVGIYVVSKEVVLAQKDCGINTNVNIIVNSLSSSDIDNVSIEGVKGYVANLQPTKEQGYIKTFQFNILSINYVSILNESIAFKINTSSPIVTSLTLCGVNTHDVNEFDNVNGIITDAILIKSTIRHLNVTLSSITISNSVIESDVYTVNLTDYPILTRSPYAYTPLPRLCDIESIILSSKVRLCHYNTDGDCSSDDDEKDYEVVTPLLRLESPVLKIVEAESLEILILTERNYSNNNTSSRKQPIKVCLSDKDIDVNGLNMRTTQQFIYAVDHELNNPEYVMLKNTYHDSIFTMKLKLFVKTYRNDEFKLKDVDVYNFLTVNIDNHAIISSFVNKGTPLEKLIKTKGKLSSIERYNNDQIRNYLKFIKGLRSSTE